MYLVEYNGDIGKIDNCVVDDRTYLYAIVPWNAKDKVFGTLEEALAAIALDFPRYSTNEDENPDDRYRETPDPEDDRIVVWELIPGQLRRAVWAFCGWHWSLDELGLTEQGKLPGDEWSLYEIANEERLF